MTIARPTILAVITLLIAALCPGRVPAGCDLSQIDDFTFAQLTNPEVVEVNQDPLGRQAHRVAVEGKKEVWARPLFDGTMAVGLFNRGRRETTVTVDWSDIGLPGPQPVRNLWTHKNLGQFEGSYSTLVQKHGAVMLKIGTSTEEDMRLHRGADTADEVL